MAVEQVLIIGLGQFGMALAEALAKRGKDVIAVDRDEDRVQRAAAFAGVAMTMDAMDEAELASLDPGARDVCVCAIGDGNREASILVTAMLRQMGARRILARATDDLHERILRAIGAHEVLSPEHDYGERLAARLAVKGVMDRVPFGEDLVITELAPPAAARGRTLQELALPRTAKLTVLAVRRGGPDGDRVLIPGPDTRINAGDVLVVVGREGAAVAWAEGD